MNHMINGHIGNHDDSARLNKAIPSNCQLCRENSEELTLAHNKEGKVLEICYECYHSEGHLL